MTLDQHDDEVADLSLRLQKLIVSATPPTPVAPVTTSDTHEHSLPNRAILERRLTQLQARLVSVHEKIRNLKDDGIEVRFSSISTKST